jgi:D-3-phosphoglycerate dehydrogenase / 2-oxoglutarate reductase
MLQRNGDMYHMATKKTGATNRAGRKPLILLPDQQAPPDFKKAARVAGVRLVSGDCTTAEEVEALIAQHNPDTILTWRLPVTGKAIRSTTRCRHIIRQGIGYDIIDRAVASEKGIFISNIPIYCVDEVSTHAIMLILAIVRDLITHHRLMTTEGWAHYDENRSMPRTAGMKLGLVGLGKIGRLVARKAAGFGMEVSAYDPYLHEDIFEAFGVRRAYRLDDLLKQSDIISLHAPLTPETRMMFTKKEFRLMRKGSYFVNTARGAMVDLDALDKVLTSGHITAAGLDVFEREPLETSHPILSRSNVIATAHMAYASQQSLEILQQEVIAESLRVLNGERPRFLVNPEVYDKS